MKKQVLLHLAYTALFALPIASQGPTQDHRQPPPHPTDSGDDQEPPALSVRILQPQKNQTFTNFNARMGLDFRASVVINGIESSTDTPVEWQSNRAGLIGVGNELFRVPIRQAGTHTLTAVAREGSENQSTSSFEFGVMPLAPGSGETIDELKRQGLDEARASIAASVKGGSIIAWQGDRTSLPNPSSSVQISLLDAQDRLITTQPVSKVEDDIQTSPHLASHEDGLSMVVWESSNGIRTTVKGMFFRRDVPIGEEFFLTGHEEVNLSQPKVTVDGQNGFIAIWQRRPSALVIDQGDIYARRFEVEGSVDYEPFRVNLQTFGAQSNPSIAPLPTRGFVAVWESTVSREQKNIQLLRFDAQDQPLGSEIQVNLEDIGIHTDPVATTTNEGDFLVVWKSAIQSSSFPSVQIFRIAGRPGQELHQVTPRLPPRVFTIIETREAAQQPYEPAVAMNRDGDFVVSWAEGPGSNQPLELKYQSFFFLDAVPRKSSDILTLQSQTAGQVAVAYTGTNLENDFLIFWKAEEDSDSSSTDLLGRRISLAYEPFLFPGFIFADGFEPGDTSAWSETKGLP